MSDIVDELLDADMGWSGDAFCVSQEVAARGAAEITKLRAERDAAARDMVLVPKEALLWLSGAGPDADGRWFGQCEDEVIKMPRKHTPRYWWRSKFRSMIPNWPKDPPTLLATEGTSHD